ncbi:MAG: hypothetical protein K1X83_10915 [Oligoflexia bacterium]|nr:hypothetical protein [Oligoflexia bacterium]
MAKGKKKTAVKRDPEKEGIFKELCLKLKQAGLEVRRERLKAGHGWRVVSGVCRSDGNRLVFVDSRLELDEQILFLRSKLDEQLSAAEVRGV